MARLFVMIALLVLSTISSYARDLSVSSYNELANAIRIANDGDTVTLTGDITMTDHPPHIDKRITVDGNGHTISGDDRYRIFVVAQSGDLTVRNLNLKNGKAPDRVLHCVEVNEDNDAFGGAICNLGRLSIGDSSFQDHTAGHGGGAIFNYGETDISMSSFSSNSARDGGAIYNSGSLTISGGSFSEHTVTQGGGAIFNSGNASFTISNSNFSNNSAGAAGGAIVNTGTGTVSHSSFTENSADFGGAVFNLSETTIANSRFSRNLADDGGGAISNLGQATVINATITSNSATELGGGILVATGPRSASSLTLRNSIIADNEGGDCYVETTSTLAASMSNYIQDGSCNTTWSGRHASVDDGFCPAARLSDGGCDIGAMDSGGTPAIGSHALDFSVASYSELARAIRSASNGDTITLTGDITMTDHPPEVTKQITIDGGGHTLSGNFRYRLFFVAESGDLTILNMTLRRGRAHFGGPPCGSSYLSSDENGGAICNNGRLTVRASGFDGNSAHSNGGAIYSAFETIVTLSGSNFSDNSADQDGGAIFNQGVASIRASSFSSNSADSGGAIYITGEASASDSMFTGNSANSGGAISNLGEATFSEISFTSNWANSGGAISNLGEATFSEISFTSNGGYLGGAISNLGKASVSATSFRSNTSLTGAAISNAGVVEIDTCSFGDNAASDHGGAINNYGNARIRGSSFARNSAHSGGAIFNHEEASLSVSDSSFDGNSSDGGYMGDFPNGEYGGGGAMWLEGTAMLSHITLANNSAEWAGGGIAVAGNLTSVRLRNSILANNVDNDCEALLLESRHNIIKDGSCRYATGIFTDPMLGDWVDATDTATGYFPLLPGSPAIDAAADSACEATDQLGNARPHGDACDIGAVEYMP